MREVDYIAAAPRMAKYIAYSTRVYQVYLKNMTEQTSATFRRVVMTICQYARV